MIVLRTFRDVGMMARTSKQIVDEIHALKEEIAKLTSSHEPTTPVDNNLATLIKTMVEERERTNKLLGELTFKIKALEGEIDNLYGNAEQPEAQSVFSNRELALSQLDSKIINYIQSRPNSMACADEIASQMNYKGRNAACSRLNRLYKYGLLDRLQLGRKVYYKFDAGKTTNTLIISPPQ